MYTYMVNKYNEPCLTKPIHTLSRDSTTIATLFESQLMPIATHCTNPLLLYLWNFTHRIAQCQGLLAGSSMHACIWPLQGKVMKSMICIPYCPKHPITRERERERERERVRERGSTSKTIHGNYFTRIYPAATRFSFTHLVPVASCHYTWMHPHIIIHVSTVTRIEDYIIWYGAMHEWSTS